MEGKVKNILKKQKGITLAALVITIVILIILAVVSIYTIFGENGLIKKAELAKKMSENAIKEEKEGMNSLISEYANIIDEDTETQIPPEGKPYVDSVLAVAPKLSDGMTPVKWNGTNWLKTTVEDKQWYNYANKEWANVVLGDATFTTSGSEEILDESKAYSMLVWIPRYAYQITSMYHTNGSGAGTVNIVFVDTNNQSKDKTKTYNDNYSNYTTGSGMEDFVVHPAFNFGTTKLPGFWVGKYETSNTVGYGDSSSTANSTKLIAQIKPNVTSWRSINISNIYTVCRELNKIENPYGLNTNDNVVDPHLMKNTEWGAVAYLSQNTIYGKGNEVTINDNSSYITADGNYISNVAQSTTGTLTGIYDMSGGAWEYTAAYVNNGYSYLTDANNGKNVYEAEAKYKDVYEASSTSGSDSQSTNYSYSTPTKGKYGDAVYETSNNYSATTSWYSDNSYFPYSNSNFFVRGGHSKGSSNSGLFSFGSYNGINDSNYSFRLVISVI